MRSLENYFVNQDTGETVYFPSQPVSNVTAPDSSPPPGAARPDYFTVSRGRRLEDPMGILGYGPTGKTEDPFGILFQSERQRYSAQQTNALKVADYLAQFLPPERVADETFRMTGVRIGAETTPNLIARRKSEADVEKTQAEIEESRLRQLERDEDIAKKRRERKVAPVEALNTYRSATQNLDTLAETAGRIMNNPSLWRATGLIGAFPNLPGGGAANVSAAITSLEAKTAFNTLQALRDASKTGGALGNVSNFEIELLKNAMAALKTSQSPEQFRKGLQDIIDYTDRAKARLSSALEGSYGDVLEKKGPEPTPPVSGGELPAAARANLREGTITTFGNGQRWTLRNGQPERVK